MKPGKLSFQTAPQQSAHVVNPNPESLNVLLLGGGRVINTDKHRKHGLKPVLIDKHPSRRFTKRLRKSIRVHRAWRRMGADLGTCRKIATGSQFVFQSFD